MSNKMTKEEKAERKNTPRIYHLETYNSSSGKSRFQIVDQFGGVVAYCSPDLNSVAKTWLRIQAGSEAKQAKSIATLDDFIAVVEAAEKRIVKTLESGSD